MEVHDVADSDEDVKEMPASTLFVSGSKRKSLSAATNVRKPFRRHPGDMPMRTFEMSSKSSVILRSNHW